MNENIDDMVRTTTRGSLMILTGQISSTIVLAIGMLFVAKLLGPSNFGSFNKAQSVVQIAFLVMNLGISSAMTKFLALYRYENKPGTLKILVETGLILNLIVSILLTAIVYSISGYVANNVFNEPEQQQYIRYLSISIVGQAIMTYSFGVTVGYERMDLRSIQSFAYSVLKSILSPILVFIGYGTLGAIIGHTSPILISGLLGLVFIWVIYKPLSTEEPDISHYEAARTILSYGFPLYLTVLLSGSLPHLYTTLLGMWVPNESIGNYSVTRNFGVLLSFVTIPIGTSIFPLFSKLEENHEELGFLYKNAVKYSTLFGYPISFTIMALADQIIHVLFQDQYIHAAHFLRVYMLTFIYIGFGMVCNSPLLNSQKRTDLTFRATLVRFAIAIPTSLVLIHRMGVIGLLITLIIGRGVNTLFNLFSVRRIFGFGIDAMFLTKNLVISVTSFGVVYYAFKTLILNPWVEIIAGGFLSVVIYLGGFVVLQVFSKQDYVNLRRLSDSFGPLKPLVRRLVDILVRLS